MATKKRSKSVPSPSSVSEDMSWRARDDLNTLTRAQEIAKDKSRLAAVRKEVVKQQKSLQNIGRLGGRKI